VPTPTAAIDRLIAERQAALGHPVEHPSADYWEHWRSRLVDAVDELDRMICEGVKGHVLEDQALIVCRYAQQAPRFQ
jgi:hypothetical protein